MNTSSVLIVDDEKNIRLTLRETLKSLDLNVDAAVNGEEALDMAAQQTYDLVLLDLKMPGMGGIDALRRLRELSPQTAVVLLTAHGNVECAVEAMKLGAVDFLQKPFAPQEIRDLVTQVFARQKKRSEKPEDYDYFVDLARDHIRNLLIDVAVEDLKTAIAIEPGKPQAFNLMGAVYELRGDVTEARRYYRAAYWLDQTYAPSRLNIERDDICRAGLPGIQLG